MIQTQHMPLSAHSEPVQELMHAPSCLILPQLFGGGPASKAWEDLFNMWILIFHLLNKIRGKRDYEVPSYL